MHKTARAAGEKESRLPAFSENDRPLIEHLHQLVFREEECRGAIEAALLRAVARFSESGFAKSYSSWTIPLDSFRSGMPEPLRDRVRLCRVFAIKAGQRAPHEERHRNSIQRLVSFRGGGIVHCALADVSGGPYVARSVFSPDSGNGKDILQCWDVMPENTWHYPQAQPGQHDWYGVAFHSAGADEIEDEYVPCTT